MRHFRVRAIALELEIGETADMTFDVLSDDWHRGFVHDHGHRWLLVRVLNVYEKDRRWGLGPGAIP